MMHVLKNVIVEFYSLFIGLSDSIKLRNVENNLGRFGVKRSKNESSSSKNSNVSHPLPVGLAVIFNLFVLLQEAFPFFLQLQCQVLLTHNAVILAALSEFREDILPDSRPSKSNPIELNFNRTKSVDWVRLSSAIELNRTHTKIVQSNWIERAIFELLIFVQLSGVESQQVLGVTSVYPGV